VALVGIGMALRNRNAAPPASDTPASTVESPAK
jgi:hypothetical protein